MVDRRVTKKKPSPLAVLGNVFLAIVLAVSLMPSYSAFGDSTNVGDVQTEELTDVQQAEDAVDTQVDQQESVQAEEPVDVRVEAMAAGAAAKSSDAQTESYVGMDMTGGQTWMVGVTVTSPSGGLPSADDGAYVSCEPVAADELSAAVAAAYDGQPGYAVALRLKVVGPDGSEAALPEGCSVRVRLIDGNGGASPKAFSLAGGALSALASYDYAGDDGMAAPGQMFDVAVAGAAALLAAPIAWVDTAGLTEKGAETTLSPGTYSVCANLFVKGEDNLILSGITAYLTGSSIPPTMPCRTNNATLVVGEDKSLTLKLDLDTVPAEVFTLQDIQSGDDVEVLSTVRGVGPNYDKYVSTGDPSVYRSDRIKSLSLKLNNAKGEYSFGACTEFPTLIGRDMNMPLTLSVDFSSAKKAFDPGDGKTSSRRLSLIPLQALVPMSKQRKLLSGKSSRRLIFPSPPIRKILLR